jgi:hypothetical protein
VDAASGAFAWLCSRAQKWEAPTMMRMQPEYARHGIQFDPGPDPRRFRYPHLNGQFPRFR